MCETSADVYLTNPVLAEKARQLLESPYFVGTTDAVLSEKQTLFLALCDLKPVSEASSGHWVPTPDGRRTVFDDPATVGDFLASLGLAYQLRHDDYATDAVVSLKPELVEAYQHAVATQGQSAVGELFGYPKTAVAAFAKYTETNDTSLLLPIEQQDRIEQEAGLADTYLVNFRFSRDHWQAELAVCQQWHATLQTYDLA